MSRRKKRTPRPRPQPTVHRPAQDANGHPPIMNPPDQSPPTDMPAGNVGDDHIPPTDAATAPTQPVNKTVPIIPAQETAHDRAGQAPTPPTTPQGQRHGPVWSASEAARRCGIGRATMTRKLQAGEIAGATRNDEGHWQVPLTGLLAAGLRPDRPTPPEDDDPRDEDETTTADEVAAAVELTELRGQLAVERARREAAEQLANERAARIDDLRHVLRALEAPTEPAHNEEEQANYPAQADQSPARSTPSQPEGVVGRLRRWWQGH